MKRSVIIALGALLCCFNAITQSTSPFSIEEVLSNSFPTQLVASAKQSKLIWVQNEKGVRNIWIAEAPEYKGRQLTNNQMDDGQEITNLQFTPDETKIIFVHGSNPNRKGEFPNLAMVIEGVGQKVKGFRTFFCIYNNCWRR